MKNQASSMITGIENDESPPNASPHALGLELKSATPTSLHTRPAAWSLSLSCDQAITMRN
ncbi:hypothetical protein VV7356_12680 [Vibrio vulnificus]|uniref:hypothetical protein n=1 Tax=Vibrio vulnificus TaxID=672 RepID=UPI000A80E238|nr:hypothetical protein [Vibrio vulnificus]NHE84098.1 hypothetical protein [Vibrio vulnificus]